MSEQDYWDPAVGDRRDVTISKTDAGTVVTDPPHTGEILLDGEIPHPIERVKKLEVAVTEQVGLTQVRAEPTGEYTLADETTSQGSGPEQWELIEELRSLAADLGCTPTLKNDVKQHSNYSVEQYQETFESFIDALEMAGLEPSVTQYNFSDREKPEDKKWTKNVRYLKANGPTLAKKLPNDINRQDKMHGAAKFTINVGMRRQSPIYYMMNEHSEMAVVRTFVKEHPEAIENISRRTLVSKANNNGNGWGEALKQAVEKSDLEWD